MFGTFRLFLALLVLLTHSGLNAGSFYQGTMAVIVFYAISGYVISFLLEQRLETVNARTFYLERIVRVYPQFVLHLVLAALVILAFQPDSRYAKAAISPETILLNLSLFPLQAKAFSAYIESAMYVPTSWSLSLEASFYLIVPFLVRYRMSTLAAVISFAIFSLAVLGAIKTHTYSYATIFGTLQFFIMGMWLERRRYVHLGIWCAAMIGLGVLVQVYASWKPPHVEETFAGAAVSLAGILLLRNLRNKKLLPLDEFLGRISYPVFLNHFLLMWAMDGLGMDYSTAAGRTMLVIFSLLTASIAYLAMERPLTNFRRSLRNPSGVIAGESPAGPGHFTDQAQTRQKAQAFREGA
ncbi:MAG: acyltransferase family protein [Hyphomonas sp.]